MLLIKLSVVQRFEEALREQQLGEVVFGKIRREEKELSCLIVSTDDKA
jgi:hypothetical protein